MHRASDRPRTMRELNPDLLTGGPPTWRQRLRSWRRRRAPGSMRALVAYLNAVLRRLGEQRRSCCAELQGKLDEAHRAIEIQTARAQAAEKRAHELANRCQAAEGKLALQERRRVVEVDPDPRQGKPGGTDLLHPTGRCTCAGEGRCAWCVDAKLREGLGEVADLAAQQVRWTVPPPPPAAPEPDPALTVADLRRADGPGPVDVAEALEDLRGLEGGLNSDCVIVEKGERFIVERPAARGNYKVSRPSGATIGFVAPTGKVRRVGNWETYEETAPAAPERCPDMRGPRGREVPGAEIAQVFFGHSGDMVNVEEEPAEHVCARCGKAIEGPMRSDGENGHVHADRCPS